MLALSPQPVCDSYMVTAPSKDRPALGVGGARASVVRKGAPFTLPVRHPTCSQANSTTFFRACPRLPLDLIMKIVEDEYLTIGSEPWASLLERKALGLGILPRCALVCKAWLPIARRLMYHHISFRYFDQRPFRLSRLIQRNFFLATLIRSLELRLSSSPASENAIGFDEFLTILGPCTHLYELKLKISVTDSRRRSQDLDEATIDVLQSLRLPLRSLYLSFQYINTNDEGKDTSLYRWLSIWPDIKFLRIYLESMSPRAPPLPPTPSLGLRLHDLRYQRLGRTRPHDFELLRWLIPPGTPSPRVLELPNWSSDPHDGTVAFVAPHVAHLRSLILQGIHIAALPLPLAQLPLLEQLTVMNPTPAFHEEPLPPSLRHLALHAFPLHDRRLPEKLLGVVTSSAHASLRVLTLDINGFRAVVDSRIGIVEACERRGIVLEMRQVVHFPSGDALLDENIGLAVVSRTFPRRATMENLGRMNAEVADELLKTKVAPAPRSISTSNF